MSEVIIHQPDSIEPYVPAPYQSLAAAEANTTSESKVASLLRRKWVRRAVGTVAAISVLAATHGKQTEMLADLALSDTHASLAEVTMYPFEAAPAAPDNSYTTPAQAYDSLQSNFAVGNNGLYKEGLWYAPLWGQTTAVDAEQTLSLLPSPMHRIYKQSAERSLAALSAYRDPSSTSGAPGGYDANITAFHLVGTPDRFVDDNLWVAGLLVNQPNITNQPWLLQRAEQLFSLAASQRSARGGIFWQEQIPGVENHDRGVVSNAPLGMLGVELYLLTGNGKYVEQSEKTLEWLNDTLLDPVTGLYNDHISANGDIDRTKWTYTQGVAAGLMAALSEVDPHKYSPQNAVDFASRAIDYFQQHGGYGNAAFDAIFFKNLLWVAGLDDNPNFTAKVHSTLSQAIAKEPADPADLPDAAGLTQLRALQALPASEYKLLFLTKTHRGGQETLAGSHQPR